jgi:hypothetical protein
MSRHIPRTAVVAALALMADLPAAPASAGPYISTSVYQSSGTPSPPANGDSPFAGCDISALYRSSTEINYVNSEVSPWVAVNPADPSNIIGVYVQDWWSRNGGRGDVAAVSHDGGQTWSASWPHFTICSGGTPANGGDYQRGWLSRVAFSPSGDAYFIAWTISPVGDPATRTSAILVSKSTDGGDHWGEPTTLDLAHPNVSPYGSPSRPFVAGDPFDANYVYAVWDRSRLPGRTEGSGGLTAFSFRGDAMFSRSTDGGATWEPARAIYQPQDNIFTTAHQLAVLPDGSLVDIFDTEQGAAKNFDTCCAMKLIRSTDRGVTWSAPIEVGPDRGVGGVNPDTGASIRIALGIPDLALDRNPASAGYGNLYAVWPDVVGSGDHKKTRYPTVGFTQSTDGGLTWSPLTRVNQSPTDVQAANPSVEVASDGTVAVTYYDFRNNTPDPGLPTDYWLIHCHADQDCTNASSWAENHVAGPFDFDQAPQTARGDFVGEYEGLTSSGTTFLPFFVQTTATDRANTYLATVSP